MPEVTEEQILEYIRLIELARAEFEGIRTDPIEAATDPYKYAGLPDEDEIRKAASILNYEDARIRGMLSDDMRAKLENAGPSMQFTEHPGSARKYQIQPPGLEDLRIDPTKKQPFTWPLGGGWHGVEQEYALNPAWLISNPNNPEGQTYWGHPTGAKGPQGTAEGVVGHELGGHGTDDASAQDIDPEFINPSSLGRPYPQGHLKAGTGRNFWSQVDAFGKEFMSRGALRIQDADDEAARGGRPGGRWDDPTKSPSVNAKERYAGLMMHIFDTGVVPTSFGNEFYEFVKGFIPNVKQEYLELDKVDPYESPHEALVRLRKERDEGTGTTDEEVERAWKRFLFSVDSRDEAAGLYDTGKARYVKAEGGPLDGFESGEWTSDTMAKPHGDISAKWTPVVAKPDLQPARDEVSKLRTEKNLAASLRELDVQDWSNSPLGGTITIPENETLWNIGRAYNIPVEDILAVNPQIENRDMIYAGERITLPPSMEEMAYLDKSDPSVIGEFGEIQQGDPRRLEYAESVGQDWVKQEMDVEQLHRLIQAWEDQQKAGVGKGFLDRLKSDPGFYMEVPPGADYDPGFTMQPPPGGWPDYDPGFYIR